METISTLELKSCFVPPSPLSHKGTNGRVLVMGGSKNSVGAPVLSSLAVSAMLAGAGLSEVAVPDFLTQAVLSHTLFSTVYGLQSEEGFFKFSQDDATHIKSYADVVAIGMGAGHGDTTEYINFFLRETDIKLIVDADGLNNLANDVFTDGKTTENCNLSNCQSPQKSNGKQTSSSFKNRAVLTPHVKEFSRLTGLSLEQIFANPVSCAEEFAQKFDCILLLKGAFGNDEEKILKAAQICGYEKRLLGAPTIITDGVNTKINFSGTPALAKGGSGDVLSGIIAGLAARGNSLVLSAAVGSYIAGRAAEIAKEQFENAAAVCQAEKNSTEKSAEKTYGNAEEKKAYIKSGEMVKGDLAINAFSYMPTDTVRLIPVVIDEIIKA